MSSSELTLTTPGVKIIKKAYKAGHLSGPTSPSPIKDVLHETIIATDKSSSSVPQAEDVASMALTAEQKEALIEKMETKKHKIKVEYRETNNQELKREYNEVCALLARVKECDAIDKMQVNISDGQQLTSEFKRKFKQLAVTDFNRIIDLTGSREGRKPDITTETWFKGRTVVFKDKVYRPPPDEKLEKFKQKMQLKPLPSDLRKTIDSNLNGNLEAANIRKNKPDLIKYKQYNPMEFSGLTTY